MACEGYLPRSFDDFRELCLSFGWREGGILMMLRGYFDDAGKLADPNSRSLVIGGFVGNMDQWRLLHDRWQPLLLNHGIQYFHGKECEHGQEEFDKSRTPKWADQQVRSDCRMDFVEAIIEAGLTGFVSGLVSSDFKALSPAQRKKTGHSFSLVAQTLLVVVKDWANERHVYDRFPYLFEAGSDGWGEFSNVLNRAMKHDMRRNLYRVESCSLVGKECTGAQAADLLAYEYSFCMGSVIDRNNQGFKRPAVAALHEKLHIHNKYHNSATLNEVLSQPKSEYRPFSAYRERRKNALPSNQ